MASDTGKVALKFQIMRLAICFISLASCFLSGFAFAQQPYYQNKTIRIIRGGEPGGSGDLQARALIPFLKKNIPGDPTIIVISPPGLSADRMFRKPATGFSKNCVPKREKQKSCTGLNGWD